MIWQEGMAEWQPITILTKRPYDNPFSAIKYAVTHISFRGRATRKEYWMFYLGMLILFVATMLLLVACAELSGNSDSVKTIPGLLLGVEFLIFIVVKFPLEARRLHDIGLSGWWQLLRIVQPLPLVGTIISILFLDWECRDSQPGRNKYGISDKYPS